MSFPTTTAASNFVPACTSTIQLQVQASNITGTSSNPTAPPSISTIHQGVATTALPNVCSASGTSSNPILQPSISSIPQGVVPTASPNVCSAIPTSLVSLPTNAGLVQSQMTNIQALAQNLQATAAGGNIFVLNVGNANNLAAALSQLVSPNPLQSLGLVGGTALPVPSFSAQTGASNIAVSQSAPTVTTAAAMSIQPNMQPAQLSQQINQAMFQVPPHFQPQAQQEPAAFMIVPIPQQSQVQTPAIFNLPSQMPGHLQAQQPAQSLQTVYMQQQPVHAQTHQVNSECPAKNPASVQHGPKSDELRSYLTQSQGWTNGQVQDSANVQHSFLSTVSSSVTNPTFAQSDAAHTSPGYPVYPSYSTVAQLTTAMPSTCVPVQQTCTVPAIHSQTMPLSSQQSNSPLSHKQSIVGQSEPAVSSPGLAFLAQISSLTTGDQSTLAHSYEKPPQTRMTISTIEDYIVRQDESHLPVLPLDDVKEGAPSCEEPSTPGESMTVSSTTKLGDDGINSLTHDNTVTIQMQPVDSGDKQDAENVLKRKTEMPAPPVILREKKKKGPAPKLSGTEVCLICSDRASGFHYNTLSCEGCKGFFRRTVIKGADYQCKQEGSCTMDMYTRRKCQKCRFEKCKAVGMKEASVLSEEKIKAKKQKKEAETAATMARPIDSTDVPKLTPQQRSLLELLQANERRFQWPTADDVKKVTVWVEDDAVPHCKALRFAHFTEMCILIVQLVVEFTKQLPGFLSVPREDQIVLLKACAIEVMLLRAAKAYNKHDGTINFLNGQFYDKATFYKAGIQAEFVDPIFTFCKSMARLDLDETEFALLVAINTFSTDRPYIKDIEKVETMQDPYVELLRLYTKIRHPDDPLMFARILMKIVELRSLNSYHSEQMFALKVQDQKLPPLLAEIWDM